ncbi:MAG: hypothetical protein ABW128_23465 [Rhizorhabdus sp.]
MRLFLALAATTLALSPAIISSANAAEGSAAAAKRGATLRDANGTRLGTIDRINADGSVQIIFNSKFVTIPADKLVSSESGVATSLTKTEVAKLR